MHLSDVFFLTDKHQKQSQAASRRDRKSTRLNSSHDQISYAVFCLKKKKKNEDFLDDGYLTDAGPCPDGLSTDCGGCRRQPPPCLGTGVSSTRTDDTTAPPEREPC